MQKAQAQTLVKETLQNDFDKERFLYFVKNLLNKVDDSKAFHAHGYVPEAYKSYVKTYERLATYTDPTGSKLDILVVYLQKETSLERARTAQRNFVARYLKDRDQKDAGLIAFVSPDPADWRFSLVKMEYKFTEGKVGKTKIREEFTPAKRWSFLVGKNENSHTAQSRLAPVVEDDHNNPTLKQLEDAFNIEKVTKEFFEKYRELFLRLYETLHDVIKQHPDIKADFAEKNVNTVDFSKKLLGQIVFLYFLQKKGWFGVSMNKSWGNGDKKFLRTLFEEAVGKGKNYFNDYLEPLFYEALAKERDDDFYSRFECKIPFLNGGLFDPISNYDWVNTAIDLPDDIFSNTRKTKDGDTGDGILDIFDRYNFTVKEDEPLEKEVAVDPEMLGKVFENLLEVKDRKSKGTYYTPREIVHYMCEQSLVNYLATELNGKVSKEDVEKLIKIGENVVEHEAVSVIKEDDPEYGGDYKRLLPDTIKDFAGEIDEKLATIKVCDPAIGSGAFPVGMMNAIVKARMVLNSYLCHSREGGNPDPNRSLYTFKRDCIQNSLYGVDIDPGAVEIAKLRLWLSLVVDEDDIKQIKPLPNLDYKIMQGNSLLEEFEGIKLFDEKLIAVIDTGKEKLLESLKQKQAILQKEYFELHSQNKLTPAKQAELNSELKKLQTQAKKLNQTEKVSVENAGLFDTYSEAKKKADDLKRLHKEFFEATQKSKKDNIKKQIEQLEWELIEATLKEQGKISALKKLEEFKRSNTKPFFLWKLNFADVFEDKGGFDVVIANPPWISNDNIDDKNKEIFKRNYGVAKSRFDLANLFVEQSLNLLKANGWMFFVIPEHIWLGDYFIPFRNYLTNNTTILEIISSKETSFMSVSNPSSIFLAQNKKPNSGDHVLELGTFYTGDFPSKFKTKNGIESRVIFNEFVQALNAKINNKGFESLAEIALVTDGIQTANLLHTIFTKEPDDKKKYHKALRSGKDIKFRYSHIESSEWWVLKPENTRTFKRPGFSYNSPKRMACFDAQEKIILRQTEPTILATLDIDKYYFPNSIFQITFENENPKKLRWLLGLLNSKFLRYFYGKLAQVEGTTKPQMYLNILKALPMPSGAIADISGIVDKVFAITEASDYEANSEKQAKVHDLEHQIDELVYKLYGLTDEEIKIVEAK